MFSRLFSTNVRNVLSPNQFLKSRAAQPSRPPAVSHPKGDNTKPIIVLRKMSEAEHKAMMKDLDEAEKIHRTFSAYG